jgi:tetratricopeptide (TPR) repeat protein
LEDIGLHDKIEIEKRIFDVHTGILSQNRKIISEVFEKGMFLTSQELPINLRNENRKINYEFLNKVTKSFHNSVIDEIEALYLIEEKLEKFKHPISHFHLASLFLKRNLFPEAIRQYEKAIKFDSANISAYIGLGISFLKSKEFNKSLEILEKALKVEEKYPDLLNYAGVAYLFQKKFEKAINLLKEAVEVNPNYNECQFNLGVALYKSALDGVKDPRAVAVPARVVIYLKQVRDGERYKSEYWQNQFTQLLELLRDNNHEIIIPEIENFQLKLLTFSPEKDKVYEFFLRFLFGGNELSHDIIENYAPSFINEDETIYNFPDYWNDLGIFHLIKSRNYYLRALSEFERAIEIAPGFKDAMKYRDMIKGNEKGFLILLRAILK